MTYYKGEISKIQDCEESITILSDTYGASRISDALIDAGQIEKFINLGNKMLYGGSTIITNGELFNLLSKYKKYSVYYTDNVNQREIVYEKIVDKSGKKFAKEIITGLMFPLGFSVSGYVLKIDYLPKNIYANDWKDKIYVCRNNRIFVSDEIKKEIPFSFSYFSNARWIYFTKRIDKSDDVMNFISNCVCNGREIEEQEVKQYLRNHSLLFKKKFVRTLKELYNENTFKRKIEIEEIKEEQPKELVSQDRLTIIMENIEYMLSKIKMISISLYNKYQVKYEELLKSEKDIIHLTPFDYKSFILLEADIKLTLSILKRNTSNIMDYLNTLKREYLNNLINKSAAKTDITIREIDEINELFLKSKDNYSIINQRMILKEFALIYLLELLENKERDDVDLENSYLKIHLKTILMYINTFIEIGFIKNNILIDFEDDITLDTALKIIDSLEINNHFEKEKVMELIK